MLSMRKPKVVIPTRFGDLVQLMSAVSVNLEEGLVPGNPDGTDGNHPFLIALFGESDGLADAALANHQAAINLREQGQVFISERDAAVRSIVEGLRLTRDWLFSQNADNFLKLGEYGFEVVQYKVRGQQKPDVIIPANFGELMVLAKRVDAKVKSKHAAGSSSFVDGIFYNATTLGEMFATSISVAEAKNNAARGRSEESQVQTGEREKKRRQIISILRKVRDYGFSVTADDYSRIGQLGFTVVENGSSGTGSDPDPVDPVDPPPAGPAPEPVTGVDPAPAL